MKIPTWAKIVGLVMVTFGTFGSVNNYQKMRFHHIKEDFSFLKEDIKRGSELAEKAGARVRAFKRR